jgi:oligopeptide/dipeptide ABC transporter ATP-binding protein
MSAPLLRVEGLTKHYRLARPHWLAPRPVLRAVEDVSFEIGEGETLGLVGESGSGKSTTARLILRLVPATAGRVDFRGRPLLDMPPAEFRAVRRQMQMVFQDPAGSLNPSYRVAELIEEPMIVHRSPPTRAERRERVAALLAQVGLDPSHATRWPHEFSGGQRQRIGIARALAVEARLLVADEPVSALDVSVQAQILNLMQALKAAHGLSYLFIAHDLAVVRHMSERVAVMYLGRIVEQAPRAEIWRRPAHPYTRLLLQAVPRVRVPDRRAEAVPPGEIPSPIAPPPGCAFHPRCPARMPLCSQVAPVAKQVAPGHRAACHLY